MPSADRKKLVRLVVPKFKLASDMSTVKKLCLSLSKLHKLNVSVEECACITSSMCCDTSTSTSSSPNPSPSAVSNLGTVPGDNLANLKNAVDQCLDSLNKPKKAPFESIINVVMVSLGVPDCLHGHVTVYSKNYLSSKL